MFTGLIEECGTVAYVTGNGKAKRIGVRAAKVTGGLKIGDSVALNGACQTVVLLESGGFGVDTLAESLAKTNLGSLRPGDRVNLERPLRVGDRLDGHLVQGHVSGTGTLREIRREGENLWIRIALPQELSLLCIPEGSICVDGISLTVAGSGAGLVSCNIIPHTWRETNLAERKPGDRLNIETDMLGRYVRRFLGVNGDGGREGGLDREKLAGFGF